jgi:thiamine-monophosphate kinase
MTRGQAKNANRVPRQRGTRAGVARVGARVDEVGEFALLDRLLPLPGHDRLVVGPGDDCAVVRGAGAHWLITCDAVVEGVHFERGWMSPHQLGRRAYLVNASDIAAMGGSPRYCVVSAAAPGDFPAADLLAALRGVAAAAAQSGAVVAGGNLSAARELMLSVCLIGAAPRHPLLRRGARPGDLLFVTGRLGDAALGLRQLRRDRRARGAAVGRFREPQPRLRAGAALARLGLARAAIDVSDGLLQDLGHLCRASGVGAVIEIERLPMSSRVRRAGWRLALAGGEDYELLCAVSVQNEGRLRRLAARLDCPFTLIGRCVEPRAGVRVVDARGEVLSDAMCGFDHFRSAEKR